MLFIKRRADEGEAAYRAPTLRDKSPRSGSSTLRFPLTAGREIVRPSLQEGCMSASETERLGALRDLRILDTPPEAIFDPSRRLPLRRSMPPSR